MEQIWPNHIELKRGFLASGSASNPVNQQAEIKEGEAIIISLRRDVKYWIVGKTPTGAKKGI
jgi:hypothetical protein